jgi:superfamily II DNA or RNA helicase
MEVVLIIDHSCLLKNVNQIVLKYPTIINALKERFTYKNPKFVNNERYGYSNAKVPEYLYTYKIIGDTIRFPRGAYKEVAKIFLNIGIKPTLIDKREKGEIVELPNNPITLREDQYKAQLDIIKNKQGIVKAATSFGKTVLCINLLFELKVRMVVVVHTTFLQKQWINEAKNLFKIPTNLIGGCGGVFKNPRLGAINICLYHTLSKSNVLPVFTHKAGIVVADEVQRAAIDMFSLCVQHFGSVYRIGVSANARRKDGMEFVIFDHIGPQIHEAEEKASDSKILSYLTIVHSDYFDYDYAFDKSNVELINRICIDEDRNKLILRRAYQKVQLEKQVMIIVERKEQCFLLQGALEKKGIRVGVLAGGVTKDDIANFKTKTAKLYASRYDEKTAYDYVKKKGESKELQVIIGTQKAEVGLSIRTLNHLIISTLATSNVEDRLNQIVGRVERTHGKELEELYGIKETPTVDIIMDTKFEHIEKQIYKVKKFFKGRITELNPRKKIVKQKNYP